ncbi:hypothetical protein Pma05_02510 [Plantactinospora mayteni]|uniref:ESX-1 secretion-associated protein n=1 Tax=Plantactinospora mayteni TaxID=566021 RepID=A0ABQ4EG37_9ACTN|nr:hypothetical protein Pma05_02510 [Plantactinospora mayteni]
MSTLDGSGSVGGPEFRADLPELQTAATRIASLADDYRGSFTPIIGAVEGTVAGNAGLPSFSTMSHFYTAVVSAAIRTVADELDTQAVQVRQAAQHFEEVDLEQRQRAAALHFDPRLGSGPGVA